MKARQLAVSVVSMTPSMKDLLYSLTIERAEVVENGNHHSLVVWVNEVECYTLYNFFQPELDLRPESFIGMSGREALEIIHMIENQ